MMEREDMDRRTGIKGGKLAAMVIFLTSLNLSRDGEFSHDIAEILVISGLPRDCP
jgi:hypothetical protein